MGLSPFEQVPRELIWQIIEYASETLFKLRAASPTIKQSVDAFVRSETRVGMLTLAFRPPVNEEGRAPFEIELIVLKRMQFIVALCIKIACPSYATLSKNYGFTLRAVKFIISLDPCQPPYDERLLSYLRTCSGHKIEKVLLRFCDDRIKNHEDSAAITTILQGKEIDSLSFRGTLSDDEILMIKEIGVLNSVILYVEEIDRADIVDRLLVLSSLVRSLKIEQWTLLRIPRNVNRRFFIGAEDLDWASIILDIFSRKVDRLLLSNVAYPHYLDSEGANELKQKLPLLDKPIWFMADFGDVARNERFEINDKIVQVEALDHHNVLSIKHSSRVDEEY